MLIERKHYHTIWLSEEDKHTVEVIDQRYLPHRFEVFQIKTVDDCYFAIKEMVVRGAPLIGVTAAYGMYIAAIEALKATNSGAFLQEADAKLRSSRPTAVNLMWALDEMKTAIEKAADQNERIEKALAKADELKQIEIDTCKKIGEHGIEIIKELSRKKNGETVNILTHCNAGWLACIDWGTATSPIYHAQKQGIDIHVWVDETRPRNQGANLTAYELGQQGVAHTLIADNTGGHLMQHGMVDMVITGTDRTTRTGDVANKIGTYLKALAADDNNIPFYIGLPSSTIDWNIADGINEILIEMRDQDEVRKIQGLHAGELKEVLLCPEDTKAANYGFDVTPARLVTGLITERGICEASEEGIKKLFP